MRVVYVHLVRCHSLIISCILLYELPQVVSLLPLGIYWIAPRSAFKPVI